jgi:signal peptidase I
MSPRQGTVPCLRPLGGVPVEFKKSELRETIESIAGSVITILFIMIFLCQSYKVDGSSMEPTLLHNQRLLVDKITYRFRLPRTGEIIVFKYPRDPEKKFIKRVIAVEGQDISIYDGQVKVNGLVLVEDYIKETTDGKIEWTTIPVDSLFVMGDNRNRSMDSRDMESVGYVPLANVIGRAVVVYWPPRAARILRRPDYQKSRNQGNSVSSGYAYPPPASP